LVVETPELWKERQGPIGIQLGKGPIESGMPSDGSDTISGRARDSAEKLEEIGSVE